MSDTTPMPPQPDPAPAVPPAVPPAAPPTAGEGGSYAPSSDPYAQPAGSGEPPKKKLTWLWVTLAVLAVVIGAFLFWRQANAVTVPSLIGLSQEEAQQVLSSVNLQVGTVTEQDSLEAEKGTVLEQSPAPQEQSAKGRTVDITVAGTPIVDVPDVTGMNVDDATAALEDEGLEAGDISEIYDESDKGTVLDQSPREGVRVEAGTQVALDVSRGPQQGTVPDVVGLSASQAVTDIQDAGFSVKQQTAFSDSVKRDTVISQSPDAGVEAEKGATVTIVVSKGPDDTSNDQADNGGTDNGNDSGSSGGGGTTPSPDPDPDPDPKPDPDPDPKPDPEPTKATVPDIVGMGPFEAAGKIIDAKLIFDFEFGPTDRDYLKVYKQSPAAGKKVDVGSTVVMTIGLPEFFYGDLEIQPLPAPAQ